MTTAMYLHQKRKIQMNVLFCIWPDFLWAGKWEERMFSLDKGRNNILWPPTSNVMYTFVYIGCKVSTFLNYITHIIPIHVFIICLHRKVSYTSSHPETIQSHPIQLLHRCYIHLRFLLKVPEQKPTFGWSQRSCQSCCHPRFWSSCTTEDAELCTFSSNFNSVIHIIWLTVDIVHCLWYI